MCFSNLFKYFLLRYAGIHNILFRFEPADCFLQQTYTMQRWIQEPHNISDGNLCNNCKQLKAVKYYHEMLHLNMTGFRDLSLTANMYTNAKIRINPVGIYLLKVKNENCRTRCVICSKLKKRHQNDVIDLKTLANIDAALVSLLLTLKRFCTFS